MKTELSRLSKEEFNEEMKRRDQEMKESGRVNHTGLKRFGSAFFRRKAMAFLYAIFRAFILIGLSYIVLYPVFRMLSKAFSEDYVTSGISIWIPTNIGLNNLKLALQYLDYAKSFWASVKVALGSALLQVIASAVTGYGFARFKFKGRTLLFGIVLMTMIVPPQIYLISMFMTYRNFDFFKLLWLPSLIVGDKLSINLIGTSWTMWIPAILGVGLRGGLFIYIFRQFFRGMSKELEEAAYIDGCSPFGTFLRIMAPNSLSAALVVFLFSLVWHWNDYFVTSMMFVSKNKARPLSLVLLSKTATFGVAVFSDTSVNKTFVLNAAAMLTILPLIVIFAFTQKYFIESVDKVGVKG
ncbi:MAG: carbohydrate ABC transporter permease [Bacillota bacterium]|nr:carbohydrate ABC transporter permease [Bacillota bacterium]